MKTNKPLITVIIPTYNREKTIYNCVKSLQNQTIKNEYYQIIVLDNHSTDTTVDIIKNNFKDIKVITNNTNIGMVSNWNKAINITETKYLALFHSDEVFHPQILEFYLEVCEKEECDIISSAITYEQNFLNIKYNNIDYYKDMNFNNFIKQTHGNIQITNAMFRLDYIKNNMFDEQIKYYPDKEWQYRVYKTASIYYIRNKLTYTKIGEHQLSSFYWKALKEGIVNDKNILYLKQVISENKIFINKIKCDKDFLEASISKKYKNEFLAKEYSHLATIQFLLNDKERYISILKSLTYTNSFKKIFIRIIKLLIILKILPKKLLFLKIGYQK